MTSGARRILLRLTIILAVALCASPAAARKAVLADLYGEPDVRREASALTVLLSSALTGAGLKVVPRGQLIEVLASLRDGDKSTYALLVKASEARRVMHSLGAKHLLIGTVAREGTKLKAKTLVFTLGQATPAPLDATAPHGRVDTLAKKLVTVIGKELDLKKAKVPVASLGELSAFGRADSATLAGDMKGAVQALRAGDPEVARKLPWLLETGRILAEMDTVPMGARLDAALFSGNYALAERLADKALESSPKDELALATKAFARLQQGKVKEAEALLARAGKRKKRDLTRLTRAAVAHAAGNKAPRDAALRTLVARGYLPALRLISTLEPGDLTPRLEKEVLKVARKKVGVWPGLATSIGLRAARGGVDTERALGLIRVELLSAPQIELLKPLIADAVGKNWVAGFRLQGELYLTHGKLAAADTAMLRAVHSNATDAHAQRLRGYILMEQGDTAAAARAFEASIKAAAKKGPRPGSRYEYLRTLNIMGDKVGAAKLDKELSREAVIKDARASKVDLKAEQKAWTAGQTTEITDENRDNALVDAFRPAAGAFAVLSGKAGATVAIAPHRGSWWHELWPAEVHPTLAGDALDQILTAPPYQLKLVTATAVTASDITPTRMSTISSNAGSDGLLIYQISPHMLTVKVRLVYYNVVNDKTHEQEVALDAEAARALGLLTIKPTHVKGVLGTVALLLLLILYRLARGKGTVKVRITQDPAARNPAYALELSRSEGYPEVDEPLVHEREILQEGATVTRLEATMPGRFTEFSPVPTGTWYVHLYGTHRKAGAQEVLDGDLTRRLKLSRGQVAEVSFDLEPSTAGIMVRVYDDGRAVRDAAVWLEGGRAAPLYTDQAGRATLEIQRGEVRVLHVQSGEQEVTREVSFGDTTLHHVTINLRKERSPAGVDLTEEKEPSIEDLLEPTSQRDKIRDERPVMPAPPTPMETEAGGMKLVSLDSRDDKVEMGIDYSAVFGGSTPAELPGASGAKAPAGLERYELLQELGRGGMGVVHRARDTVLEREVALKIIGAELKDHPEARKLFVSEAKAMAALNHPNLVMIFDQGWAGDQTFVVMEYVEGTTLERMIKTDGPPPVNVGLDYFDQLCCGLTFAHGRNIVHRDIKPENIFISTDGVVKLGDFGLAKATEDLKAKKTEVRGTPMYMAPEQIQGQAIDHRADIYSLGCTAYALFCGRPPFIEGEVMYHHVNTPPPRPSELAPHLPAELDRVLLACLAKQKGGRVGTVQELRKAIKPLLLEG